MPRIPITINQTPLPYGSGGSQFETESVVSCYGSPLSFINYCQLSISYPAFPIAAVAGTEAQQLLINPTVPQFSPVGQLNGGLQNSPFAYLPPGAWEVALLAGMKVQKSPDGFGGVWRDIVPTGTGGTFLSDGQNTRINMIAVAFGTCAFCWRYR